MKKLSSLIIILLGCVAITYGQSDLKRANRYFENAYYAQAIPLYKEITKKNSNTEVIKNLADSYYNIGDFTSASRWYRYLANKYGNDLEADYRFKYVQTLKANNNYADANKIERNYLKSINDLEALAAFEKDLEYLENVRAIGDRYALENLKINTEFSEFGMIEHGSEVVFAAPKKQNGLLTFTYGWNGEAYLDLYSAEKDRMKFGDSVAKPFSEKINTKLHEANAVFTKDGKTMYFTRNFYVDGKKKTDENDVVHIELFKATWENDTWTNITVLPFNGENFSIEHPALSPDEKTLYFASDMPGTNGSFDIFSVAIKKDGMYGEPVNLGSTINTPQREQFPFVASDGSLYFSSNGHPGFGALDVFISETKKGTFQKPDNVGTPVNSGFDDFSFNINQATKQGYFASNRPGGKGKDDIYSLTETKDLNIEDCGQFIAGTITDAATNEVLKNVTLQISNETDGNAIAGKITTDENGTFKLPAGCELSIVINASKAGYQNNEKKIFLGKRRNQTNDASMALVSLESIRKQEEAKRVAAEKMKVKEEKDRVKNIIQKEKDIVKRDDKLMIRVENMRFDYNLWYMRRDSKKISQKVIDMMKKYPEMVLEIGTHTDIRGTAKYNQELSQKRANSVLAYFIEEGIEANRITAIGYGEAQPIQECATEDACDEEQHETNRRCEFVIKSL
ncbi:OmpA family protein [Cochleicola gelatinilyticus]|uniref:OmpA-like domain-containing protein n=1 Tax=Cochleicola gelatinilyticus TaxID=1763537 RepID=A0A167HHF7_9FLAO|nr:OmpA family protein [Cochleicola gelatinilyticus]OAB78608.1 hypothetical protein ULVI_08445 [Cochleicola gelatinilyticus]